MHSYLMISTCPHVLIAEDVALIAMLLEDTLTEAGFRVTVATNGWDALNYALADRPDLAVVDWKMPGPSEAALVRQLRAQRPGLPVVVVSGSFLNVDELEDLGDGPPVPFLAKPVDLDELVQAVRALAARQPVTLLARREG